MKAKKTSSEKKLDNFFKQIGLNIRAAREARQMTLEEAEEAGYPSWRHLQKVESGYPMTMKTLYNVSKAIGVHPSELLAGVKL